MKIYRDPAVNHVFFMPSNIEPKPVNSLHAVATDEGLIDIFSTYNVDSRQMAGVPHTEILDQDGNPAGNSLQEVVNYLNSQFVATSLPNGQAPSITSPLQLSVLQNSVVQYAITATHNPYLFLASGLPTGLTCNPQSGVITGVVSQPGVTAILITAVNTWGADTQTLTLTTVAAAPGYHNTVSTSFRGAGYQNYLTIPAAAEINQGSQSPFSLAVWLYLPSIQASDLFSQGIQTDYRYVGLDASGRILLRFLKANKALSYRGGTLTAGAWHHVMVIFSAPGCAIYIDGVSQAVTTLQNDLVQVAGNSGDLRIGRAAGNVSEAQWLQGYLDDFAYFDIALSAPQAAAVWNLGTPFDLTGLADPPLGNLKMWFLMGDGDAYPTLADNVGGHNATMINMTALNLVNFVP